MKRQLEALIVAMTKGLEIVPNSTRSWLPTKVKYSPQKNIIACCPLAHVAIGLGQPPSTYFSVLSDNFPDLNSIRVHHPSVSVGVLDLSAAIETLSGQYKWSTEQVIDWLKKQL